MYVPKRNSCHAQAIQKLDIIQMETDSENHLIYAFMHDL